VTAVNIRLPSVRRFHPKERCVARLMCFPHAGGSAVAFSRLSSCLPPDFELLAVQYPGRLERRADPSAPDISALAEESARAMSQFSDRPLALFGHSMGSLVALESARMIVGQQPLLRLFVSAAQAPSRDWSVTDADTLDDTALAAYLRRLGGMPEEVLNDEELRDEVLRVLRADYRLVRHYRPGATGPLPVPITAMVGDTDPVNAPGTVWGWARHTSLSCGVEVLPGGHFYINDQLSAVAAIITRYLDHDLQACTARSVAEESP
jgi:surfactin synthase thioesterase subunit